MGELILLGTFLTHAEADVAASLLESHKIPSDIASDDLSGLAPSLPFAGGVRLLVPREYLKVAKRLLDAPIDEESRHELVPGNAATLYENDARGG